MGYTTRLIATVEEQFLGSANHKASGLEIDRFGFWCTVTHIIPNPYCIPIPMLSLSYSTSYVYSLCDALCFAGRNGKGIDFRGNAGFM